MITILTEKPSVAQEIAKNIGALELKEGYYQGRGYAVTWTYGHLVQISCPEGDERWSMDDLPIIPKRFFLTPRTTMEGGMRVVDEKAVEQLEIIRTLFNQSESIIEATDAGPEGELIFRNTYEYLECDKPVYRLWIYSITDSAIRKGLSAVYDWKYYDNIYQRARCRAESDWIIGINATRTLTLCCQSPEPVHVGRVLTPCVIATCDRYVDNLNFKGVKTWGLKIEISKGGKSAILPCDRSWASSGDMEAARVAVLQNRKAEVTAVRHYTTVVPCPLPYDLTTLQKEANIQYGYSAERTENIVQKLYEKKLMSYPRTDSRYITDDVFDLMGDTLGVIRKVTFIAANTLLESDAQLNRACVNEMRVTDHHALVVTPERPKGRLPEEERKIYSMVALRLEEALAQEGEDEVYEIRVRCEDVEYLASARKMTRAGWRDIRSNRGLSGVADPESFPDLSEGEVVDIAKVLSFEKESKPRGRMTEAELLGVMEDCNLGTPATRAETIEGMVSRGFVERYEGALIPTIRGLGIYYALRDLSIADVALTSGWEERLKSIEEGTCEADAFRRETEDYTRELFGELQQDEVIQEIKRYIDYQSVRCPVCGAPLGMRQASANCPNCGKTFSKYFKNKRIPDKEFINLLKTGQSGRISGFVASNGNTYSAFLRLNAEGDIEQVFGSSNQKKYQSKNQQ